MQQATYKSELEQKSLCGQLFSRRLFYNALKTTGDVVREERSRAPAPSTVKGGMKGVRSRVKWPRGLFGIVEPIDMARDLWEVEVSDFFGRN